MPEVTHGDTSVSYVVLVLDASDNYVWGTYGSGSLQIRIGGDKRSQEERIAFNRENAAEYNGMMAGTRGGGGFGMAATAGGVTVGTGGMGGRGGRARAGGGGSVGGGGGSLGGGRSVGGAVTGDSVKVYRLGSASADSTYSVTVLRESAGVAVVRPTVPGGRGGAIGPVYGVADATGGYLVGFGRIINGQTANLNEAAGLQDPNDGESGIQGLKSSSLTMGETYFYPPGQLAANQPLRVVVVHLAPGTRWNGR
jgi:hypothetical protein